MMNFNYDLKCCYCGKFIAYKDFDNGNARRHFIPDSDVSSEEMWDWHVKCEPSKIDKGNT